MIFKIITFDTGPHWTRAFIEADSSEEARALLRDALDSEDITGICNRLPEETWTVTPVAAPLRFILGCGCR